MEELLIYKTDFPKSWSFLGSPEEAAQIPLEHKDQIHFLNEEGTKWVRQYLHFSKMIGANKEPTWSPFYQDYFKETKCIENADDDDEIIKKWLYNLGIPFKNYVLVDEDRSGHSVLLSWKMVIKYWHGLFFPVDTVVFDLSLNWCVYFWHEDWIFYGKNNTFDKEAEYQKTLWINELRKNSAKSKQGL